MSRQAKNNKVAAGEQYVWNTALYVRLSREDGDKEESDSIGNQRDMLLSYIDERPEFRLTDVYIDDGYTGTNFERPDFKRMLNDITSKKVNCIIVKDLSRFGREYINVGNYLDFVFPKYKTRFIAINDAYDNHLNKDDWQNLLVPIRNIMNEQYARDISHKVRSAFDTKRKRGEFIGAFASYGYQKDPVDKHKLIVDEEVADVVRNIFQWFVGGMPKLSIAYKLNSLKIPCPSEYKKSKGMKYVNPNKLNKTTYWTHSSIHRILLSEMYIGNMVQKRQSNQSFKNKKNVQLEKEQWIIVKGTHEALISKDIWETAQRLLQSDIKKSQYTGEVHLFAGLIKCGDCGRAMTKRKNQNNIDYICGTYKMYGASACTSHRISAEHLKNNIFALLNDEINKYVQITEADGNEVLMQLSGYLKAYDKKLSSINSKIEHASVLKDGLYEDYKDGVLTKEEYLNFKNKYETEIIELKKEQELVEQEKGTGQELEEIKNTADLLSQYKNKLELDREMVTALIESVIVYENQKFEVNFTFKSLS